jgi:hypothetical protein
MTPAETAVVDQALAEYAAQVDVFLQVYLKLRDKHGPEQAAADMCALFGRFPAVEVAATLASAIVRIAEGGA